MTDKEFKKRCNDYVDGVKGYFVFLSMYIIGLVTVTATASAYAGMFDLWFAIAVIFSFFCVACFAFKESILDKIIMCWSDTDDQ